MTPIFSAVRRFLPARECQQRRCSTIWRAERRSIDSWISFRPFPERRQLLRWTSPEAPSWLVRILLDENLPRDLVTELTGHQVTTVQAVGWSGTKNGELLRRAHGRFDVLVTMDRGLQYQQNLRGLSLGVLTIRALSNRMVHLKPFVDSILKALQDVQPGQVREVGAS